jgi:hypothetical protein
MRFANVDGQKVGMIFIVFVNFDDVTDLATKRRSSVTAEDHHQRPAAAGALSQLKVIFAV